MVIPKLNCFKLWQLLIRISVRTLVCTLAARVSFLKSKNNLLPYDSHDINDLLDGASHKSPGCSFALLKLKGARIL